MIRQGAQHGSVLLVIDQALAALSSSRRQSGAFG
jgi:hypothetical protein